MRTLASQRAMTMDDVLKEIVHDIELAIGVEQKDESPLWSAMPASPGRGITMGDNRILSPQQAAVESPADELFFGGGPGGGKTDLILGLALTKHRSSIIFRRQFAQLRGAEGIIERSRQIVGLRGDLSLGIWRNLPGGRSLEFAGCDYWKDVLKYKGRPHDAKLFDELPEFPEASYRFLIGWLRTAHPGQRTRVVGTGNPPVTEEGQWVLRYWGPWLDKTHPHPAAAGELRWFVVDEHGVDKEVPGPTQGWERPERVKVGDRWVRPRSRTFIPSAVEDNPYYMQTGYADVLDALPEPLRSQMRFGNFQAAHADHPWQVIPSEWVLAAQRRWKPNGGEGIPLTAVGNDPSRGGADEFVIAPRHDNWIAPLIVYQGHQVPDGPTGAAYLHRAVGGDGDVPVNIDIIGSAGSSVYDHAKSLGLKAVALNGSSKTKARDKTKKLGFVNKRAEWHWNMREILDPSSGMELALPPDAQLRSDLCAPRWTVTVRGIQIEDKDDIKARLGRSPDRGEGVIYACAHDRQTQHGVLFTTPVDLSAAEAELARLKAELGIGGNGGNGNGHGP